MTDDRPRAEPLRDHTPTLWPNDTITPIHCRCGLKDHMAGWWAHILVGVVERAAPARTADDVLNEDFTYVEPWFAEAFRQGWEAREAEAARPNQAANLLEATRRLIATTRVDLERLESLEAQLAAFIEQGPTPIIGGAGPDEEAAEPLVRSAASSGTPNGVGQ